MHTVYTERPSCGDATVLSSHHLSWLQTIFQLINDVKFLSIIKMLNFECYDKMYHRMCVLFLKYEINFKINKCYYIFINFRNIFKLAGQVTYNYCQYNIFNYHKLLFSQECVHVYQCEPASQCITYILYVFMPMWAQAFPFYRFCLCNIIIETFNVKFIEFLKIFASMSTILYGYSVIYRQN